jgi:hypothetical protein
MAPVRHLEAGWLPQAYLRRLNFQLFTKIPCFCKLQDCLPEIPASLLKLRAFLPQILLLFLLHVGGGVWRRGSPRRIFRQNGAKGPVLRGRCGATSWVEQMPPTLKDQRLSFFRPEGERKIPSWVKFTRALPRSFGVLGGKPPKTPETSAQPRHFRRNPPDFV